MISAKVPEDVEPEKPGTIGKFTPVTFWPERRKMGAAPVTVEPNRPTSSPGSGLPLPLTSTNAPR